MRKLHRVLKLLSKASSKARTLTRVLRVTFLTPYTPDPQPYDHGLPHLTEVKNKLLKFGPWPTEMGWLLLVFKNFVSSWNFEVYILCNGKHKFAKEISQLNSNDTSMGHNCSIYVSKSVSLEILNPLLHRNLNMISS